MTADPVLARLSGLHPKTIDLSLSRIERLLNALGNPQDRLPPVIHVAGTNGKGSVVAYLRAGLQAAGYRVHTYISPHLVRFNERIRIAGALIDDDALTALLEECEAANRGEPITFFEITTAAAFLAFARNPADATLLEVGLGGRLDATNVVKHPWLCAITPVSLDHMHYLGNSLTAIAGEKAGILKPDVMAIVGPQTEESAAAIAARARDVGAPLYRHGIEWTIEPRESGFFYSGHRAKLELPLPRLPGRHQIDNAGMAVACFETLPGFRLKPAHIHSALTDVEWPARLQRLRRGPLVERLPVGWELWLDGGHNPAAAEALAAWAAAAGQPLDLVFGMLDTKDAEGFLRKLAGVVRQARAIVIPGDHPSLSADGAAAAAKRAGIGAAPAPSVAAAIDDLVRGTPAGRLLICGSLYLAGTVLVENG